MTNERARTVARWLSGVLTLAVVSGLGAGAAHADETNTASHNGPRVGLINVGQVDDPMEDVLEHVLLIGDGYTWR
jgi:phosphatidylserine decarboxylase